MLVRQQHVNKKSVVWEMVSAGIAFVGVSLGIKLDDSQCEMRHWNGLCEGGRWGMRECRCVCVCVSSIRVYSSSGILFVTVAVDPGSWYADPCPLIDGELGIDAIFSPRRICSMIGACNG